MRHLHCFLAAAQERNLRKAADKLHLTQPAISKTLSELEEIVGVKLLERNRLGARLTRDGEAFLPHAVSVLEALDAVTNAVGQEQKPAHESIYIGALPTVAPDLIPAVLPLFRQRHPQAKVLIQTAANAPLLQMLTAGEVDFVLGRMADPQMMAGLSFELLYVEPLVFAVRNGHPLAARPSVSLSDIVAHSFVISPKGTIPRHNAESYLQSRGLAIPANSTETLSVSVARQITRHSDAVWFTPAGAAREDLADRTLVQLAVPTEGTEEPVGLLLRSEGTLTTLAREFVRMLRETAATRRSARSG
nr:pca operon transcription factor PcaQ [Noviherbaspirillum cavernae]